MKLNLPWRSSKSKSVDKYLTNKANLIRLIVFTAFFSLCFINIYKPFNSGNWYNVSPFKYFLFSSLLVLTGILVLAFSRFLMYRFVKKHSLYYTEYALWVIAEVAVLSIFYTLYTLAVNNDLSWTVDDIATIFKEANINTVLIIFFPYAVSWLYFSYEDKKMKLRDIEQQNMLENPSVIQFKNDKGELRFSVAYNNIIYIEAADNYVVIKYKNKGNLSVFMLRNNLKKLAEDLKDTSIKRCHRSYMVNFEHVIALRRKNEEINLEFDMDGIKEIPVSKTYSSETTEAFLMYSGRK